MNRAKKNKRNKKKKKNQYYYHNQNLNSNKINENDNAAPPMNSLNFGEKEKDIEENFAPAGDIYNESFNNCINLYSKFQKIDIFPKKEVIDFGKTIKSLKFMKKVYQKDLILDCVHDNCFILLEIKSNALPVVSLQFYADDENHESMYVTVYNFHGKFSIDDFKQGKYMIIMEPYYKQFLDSQIGIRVDDPNDIILFKDKEEAYNYILKENENFKEDEK